jgi:superfamily II DNA/RNA helicase
MKLNDKLQNILTNLGISELNQIQEAAFMPIKKEAEVVLLAPTGSGKTLAFLLPIFTELKADEKRVQCLILTPSRELAIQIEQVWRKMATGFKVNVCYGGHDMSVEVRNLSTPPALLIGTPGRIADHIDRETFDTSGVHILVLDEFDKSLGLGFHDQMAYISENLKEVSSKVLVSATSKIQIPEFTGIKFPQTLDFTKEKEEEPLLTLHTLISEEKDKIETLYQLLCNLGAESTLIFCNHREAAERTSALLWERGVENAFFHGGMEQIDRERTLIQFRNGSTNFLVASDLAARGLDISAVKNIIHYHLPLKSEDFVHRNGRTARMKVKGNAYIILHKEENVPHYLDKLPKKFSLKMNLPSPKMSDWTTLYISGGKKDKLSKGDILGFLAKTGGLAKEEIGLIEQMDFMSFAAVKKEKLATLLPIIQVEKMKGKKYKIRETGLNDLKRR